MQNANESLLVGPYSGKFFSFGFEAPLATTVPSSSQVDELVADAIEPATGGNTNTTTLRKKVLLCYVIAICVL